MKGNRRVGNRKTIQRNGMMSRFGTIKKTKCQENSISRTGDAKRKESKRKACQEKDLVKRPTQKNGAIRAERRCHQSRTSRGGVQEKSGSGGREIKEKCPNKRNAKRKRRRRKKMSNELKRTTVLGGLDALLCLRVPKFSTISQFPTPGLPGFYFHYVMLVHLCITDMHVATWLGTHEVLIIWFQRWCLNIIAERPP